MKVTFFGDSFTSGEGNDNFSFVEQLPFPNYINIKIKGGKLNGRN